MHPDRASGPDGLNGRLIQQYWDLFSPYVLREVKDFFTNCHISPKKAMANVVLIPKTDSPTWVTDFRPISVCNFIYKIISKVLSCRMRPLMSRLVMTNQSAFVPGREISDNTRLLREILHTFASNQFNKPAFCFKCDLSKAFDRMEWPFVAHTLKLYGFPTLFINWIMECVTSAKFTLLINGSSDGFIAPTRGLRQGCALSPYLFILCMDVLSRMMDRKTNTGTLVGLKLTRQAPSITTMLYADDVLVCGLATHGEAMEVLHTINSFCQVSGQQIGADKSKIWFSKITNQDMRGQLMQLFQATHGDSSNLHLGVPMVANKTCHFSYLLNKIDARIQTWKAKLLSQAGKVVLIKSVVEPMVLYSMGAGPIPQNILDKINAKVRAFFWNNGGHNKMRLVNWATITQPKCHGGLGLRDFKFLDKAMTMKVLWKLACNEHASALWVQVLSAKYLSNTPLWLASAPSRCTKLWREVLHARESLRSNVQWLLGRGDVCSLFGQPWHPFWLQFRPPNRRDYNTSISDVVQTDTCTWHTAKLIELLGFNGALFIACSFPTPPLKPNHADRLLFTPVKSGVFSFKDAYKLIHPTPANSHLPGRVWKEIWHNPYLLPRVRLFLWKAVHRALPIKGTFARRMRMQLPHCDVCGQATDDDLHVLFQCDKARQMWFASTIGMRTDSLPHTVPFVIEQLVSQLDSKNFAIFANLVWSFWKDRCKHVYEGKPLDTRPILLSAGLLLQVATLCRNDRGVANQGQRMVHEGDLFRNTYCLMDGSHGPNDGAGWAYTIHRDQHLLQFGMCSGTAFSPFHAELLAFVSACQAAISLSLESCVFYSDCEILVNVLNGQLAAEGVDWKCYHLILDALMLLRQHSEFSFFFLPRTFCHVEHQLANVARTDSISQVGFTYPIIGRS